MKDQPDRNNDNKLKSELKGQPNLNTPEQSNKCRSKKCLRNKLGQKRPNLNQPFANKDKSDSLRKSLSMKERSCSKSTRSNERNRLYKKLKRQSMERNRKTLRIKRLNSCMKKKPVCCNKLNTKKSRNLKSLMFHRSILWSCRKRRSTEREIF